MPNANGNRLFVCSSCWDERIARRFYTGIKQDLVFVRMPAIGIPELFQKIHQHLI